MRVTVVAFGAYARLLPPGGERGRLEVQVEEGTSVGQLADSLDLPEEVRRYVTREGVRLAPDELLRDGDTIRFVVPLAGG